MINGLDINIDKLKGVVKKSTLSSTEKLDLIIFLDLVAISELDKVDGEENIHNLMR